MILAGIFLGHLSLETAAATTTINHFSTSISTSTILPLMVLQYVVKVPFARELILKELKHSRLPIAFLSRNMRILQFVEGGKQRVGVELKQDGDIVDISAFDPSIPSNMRSFLEDKDRCIEIAKRYVHILKACIIPNQDNSIPNGLKSYQV